jgi:tetratricopeptide (TPR) repeat protein
MSKDKTHAEKKTDLAKLLNLSPTKIPKVTKEAAQAVGHPALEWKRLGIFAAIISLVVVIAYANSLWGQLVFNDGPTLAFITSTKDWDAFWSQLWAQALAVPFSQQWLKATFAWDYQSAGMNLFWFHTVNVGLHLATCLYLFALLFRISRRLKIDGQLDCDPYYLAFAASVLFACHPLTSESVAHIAGRIGPLWTATYLLSLNLFFFGYLGHSKAAKFWGYTLAAVFLAIGLLITPNTLTLPLTALVIAICLKPHRQAWLEFASEHVFSLAACVLLLGTLPYLTFRGMMLQAGNGLGLATLEPIAYYATQLKAIPAYYLRLFVVPVGLSVDPPFVLAQSFADILVIVGIVLVLATVIMMFVLRSKPIIVLALYMFLIGFVPVALLVQPEVASDQRFYFPLIGLCIIAGWGLARLANLNLRNAGIACGAIVIVLAGLTIWRNTDWYSGEALWKSAINVNQKSARAHAMYALELMHKNKMKEAAIEAKEAIKLDGQLAPAFITVAGVLLHEKDYEGARDAFSAAMELAKKQNLSTDIQVTCMSGLAESFMNLNQPQYAIPVLQQAMAIDAENARLHFIAGRSFLQAGQYQMAIAELQTALKMDASLFECWQPMAEAAIEMNAPDMAYGAANMAVMRENSTPAKLLLARADIAGGRFEEAKNLLTQVCVAEPENAQALAIMSVVQGKLGQSSEASSYRSRALKADPEVFSKVKIPGVQGQSSGGSSSRRSRRRHRRHN